MRSQQSEAPLVRWSPVCDLFRNINLFPLFSGIDVVSEAPEEKPLQNNPSRDGIVSQASSHIVSSEAKDDRTGRPSEAHRDASSVQPPALVESLASPSRNGDDAPHGGDQENDTLAQVRLPL